MRTKTKPRDFPPRPIDGIMGRKQQKAPVNAGALVLGGKDDPVSIWLEEGRRPN
jgi:hypothetical protein